MDEFINNLAAVSGDYTAKDGGIVAQTREQLNRALDILDLHYADVSFNTSKDKEGHDTYLIKFGQNRGLRESMEEPRTKINIKEELNRMDADTYCKYDMMNIYESLCMTKDEKMELANLLKKGEDADYIGAYLNDKYNKKFQEIDELEKTFAESLCEEEKVDVKVTDMKWDEDRQAYIVSKEEWEDWD